MQECQTTSAAAPMTGWSCNYREEKRLRHAGQVPESLCRSSMFHKSSLRRMLVVSARTRSLALLRTESVI